MTSNKHLFDVFMQYVIIMTSRTLENYLSGVEEVDGIVGGIDRIVTNHFSIPI